MRVTVYSKPHCPACEHTRRDLDRLGITYALVDLTTHPEARNRLVSTGHRAAPVVETGTGSWSGYQPARIAALTAA